MNTVIVAWALVVSPGLHNAYAVSGIDSEAECERLASRVKTFWQSHVCASYRAAGPFVPPQARP